MAVLAFGLLRANAQIPAPNSQHYDNFDYQFSTDLPQRFQACVDENTNHGVVILLNSTVCRGFSKIAPRIAIFANYNVPYEARTPAQLARHDCSASRFDPAPRRIEWLHAPTLGGRRAVGCCQYFRDGRIAEWIVTLHKTDEPVWDWIEVAAYLETTTGRYAKDLRIFRRVLKGVWIHPDGPFD